MNDLIEKLSNLRSQFNCFNENERDAYHTLSEAIKVLSERPEPCEDAVSRQAVLDEIRKCTEVYINNLPPMIDKAEVQTKIMLMPPAQPERKMEDKWIPCSERLPEMHDAGILKKLGIKEQSNKCIITVAHETESVVDNDAWLKDGKWYSDYLRFLKEVKKPFEVTAWMPLPEPYKPKENE